VAPSSGSGFAKNGCAALDASRADQPAAGDHVAMAYDEELAGRIRELVVREPGLTERRMFGGLAFLINGNMAVAASGQGGLMLRVDPGEGPRLVQSSNAVPMVMRGRELAGWLRVDAQAVVDDSELARWVAIGVAYARSLAAKH
jgi:TfoX/Sxy family transcriptional regulator of competence genes